MVAYILVAIIAYLIGSISFSVIISKKMAGFDVREKGSGNAGSTNVLRSVGKKAALMTLACDVLKGVVAVLIAFIVGKIAKNANPAILVQIAALFAVIGHTFPVFFNFKGGKGVATSLGIVILLNWQIGLICLVFALALMVVTRMVSLGSISAAVLFPVLTIFIKEHYLVSGNYVIFGILLAAFVIYNHRANVQRILAGTENKLSFSKKTESTESTVENNKTTESATNASENQETKNTETSVEKNESTEKSSEEKVTEKETKQKETKPDEKTKKVNADKKDKNKNK
jgi:glycerol-3-phosphate acyltransferase PlsY